MGHSTRCRYHQNKNAIWHCQSCDLDVCQNCAVYSDDGSYPVCVLCRRSLSKISIANEVPGLNTALPELIGEALHPVILLSAMIFAILFAVFPTGRVGSVLSLLAMMPLFELAHNLLERRAANDKNHLVLSKLFQAESHFIFVKLVTFYFFSILLLSHLLQSSLLLGSVASLAFVVALPASFTILAMEKSIFSMFHPAKIIWILKLFGKDYWVLYFQF